MELAREPIQVNPIEWLCWPVVVVSATVLLVAEAWWLVWRPPADRRAWRRNRALLTAGLRDWLVKPGRDPETLKRLGQERVAELMLTPEWSLLGSLELGVMVLAALLGLHDRRPAVTVFATDGHGFGTPVAGDLIGGADLGRHALPFLHDTLATGVPVFTSQPVKGVWLPLRGSDGLVGCVLAQGCSFDGRLERTPAVLSLLTRALREALRA